MSNSGKWYVRRGKKVQGPISSEKLKDFAARGLIKTTDLLKTESSDQWVSPSQIKGLFPDNAGIEELPPLPDTEFPSALEPTNSPPPFPSGQTGTTPPFPSGQTGMTPPFPSGQTGMTKNCGLATTSLVLGILSFCLSIITAIPGLITGIMGLRQINETASAGSVRLTGKGKAITGIILSSINIALFLILLIAVGLLLPAIQQARQAARRSTAGNQLKMIALGFHSYADQHDPTLFPGDIYDANGMPLLSWRVKILPHMGDAEAALYEQFHLNEPWDSPHNIQLLPQMPSVYRCPSQPDEMIEKTLYIAPKGKDYYLSPAGEDLPLRRITDGMSSTIAVVQVPVSAGIEWTKPDTNWSENNNWIFEDTVFPGGFLVCLCDGSVTFISSGIDRSSFNAMLTPRGFDEIKDRGY